MFLLMMLMLDSLVLLVLIVCYGCEAMVNSKMEREWMLMGSGTRTSYETAFSLDSNKSKQLCTPTWLD